MHPATANRSLAVWLFGRSTIVKWVTGAEHPDNINAIPHAIPSPCFSDSYIEIQFVGVVSGLLARTVSGEKGVAFTLGNAHETKLALDYVEHAILARPALTFLVLATAAAQVSPEFADLNERLHFLSQKSDTMNFTKVAVPLRTTPVDVDSLTRETCHPNSVLSACAIAHAFRQVHRAVVMQRDLDRGLALSTASAAAAAAASAATYAYDLRNDHSHHHNGNPGVVPLRANVPGGAACLASRDGIQINSPTELLGLPFDHPLLRNVGLSMHWRPGPNRAARNAIFDLTKLSHRERLQRLLADHGDAFVKCFVHRTNSPDVADDVQTLYYLASILGDGFDDEKDIDTRGLTFRKLVSENSCRWRWKNSDAMSDELVRRATVHSAQNYVYLVGLTGEGKSTTFNMLLDLRPGTAGEGGNRWATVGAERSTTTVLQEGRLYADDNGSDESDTSFDERKPSYIIDTPGLCDDGGRDRHILFSMVDYVSQRATANLVLLVKQKAARVDDAEYEAVREYRKIFGENFGKMLRIVCTSVPALSPTGDFTEPNQVTVESVRANARELFREFGETTDDVDRRVYFLGDVKELEFEGRRFMPLRKGAPDPRREVERLRADIRGSRPKQTIAVGILSNLLRDASSFWADDENMRLITQQAMERIWFPDARFDRVEAESGPECAVFRREWTGAVGWFNYAIGTELGQYDMTVTQLSFHGNTFYTKRVLDLARETSFIFEVAVQTGYLVALVEERDTVEGRVRKKIKQFELIQKDQELTPEQRRRVAGAVLGENASREEVRAGVTLCGSAHCGYPAMWM